MTNNINDGCVPFRSFTAGAGVRWHTCRCRWDNFMEESVINVISNTCAAMSSERLYCIIYIRLLSNIIIMTMSDMMRTITIMNVLQQNVNVNLWAKL